MVQYRRNRAPGGTFFFTAVLRDRTSTILTDHISALRSAFRDARARRPFSIDAIVVLPDHLHTIWTLPPGNTDYSVRWQQIKGGFTRRVIAAGVRIACDNRGEYVLWQRRFWEHTVRDDADLVRCVDYVHFNPVKHGHVSRVEAWPHSSFHRYVKAGTLPADWGGDMGDTPGSFGERSD